MGFVPMPKCDIYVSLDTRDDKVIVNSHIQSEGIRVQTTVMTSDLITSTFLTVELGLIRLYLFFMLLTYKNYFYC